MNDVVCTFKKLCYYLLNLFWISITGIESILYGKDVLYTQTTRHRQDLQRKEEVLSHEKLLSRDSWVLDGAARISRFALADS